MLNNDFQSINSLVVVHVSKEHYMWELIKVCTNLLMDYSKSKTFTVK